MDILFTGSLSLLSRGIFDKLGTEYRCVLFDEKLKEKIVASNIAACFQNEEHDDEALKHVFETFCFDTVVYFSQALDGTLKIFDELEKMEHVLYICRQFPVKHFVYIISNDMAHEAEDKDTVNSRKIVMQSCKRLCMSFAGQTKIQFTMLQIPYLYSMQLADNQLSRWIMQAVEGKKLQILGAAQAYTDFLCEDDLGELLSRMLDNPIDESYLVMKLSGDNRVTFEEICSAIRAEIPNVEVEYENYVKCVPVYDKDERARKEYGWIPMRQVCEDIRVLVQLAGSKRKRTSLLKQRRLRHKKFRQNMRIVAELVLAYLLTLGIEYGVRNNVLLNYIDFKFVYVVVMGTLNGMSAGIIAAVLASVGYVLEKSGNVQWQVLFYNVQNWLPFACYFLLGTISGYTLDRHEDEIIFAREEKNILEQKYVFLSELYKKTLENKESYNSQIIGYQDSWGKLYSVMKELNTSLPEEVFFKAVDVLEELLDNRTVAVYSVNGSNDFARLSVCSKSVSEELFRSMRLSDYPDMKQVLDENKLFINTCGQPHYPAYAKAIYRDGEMMAVVLLLHVTDGQMNMEYANKFTIISELIKDTLIRAVEIEKLSDRYIGDTQVLKPAKFLERLKLKERMREKEYLEFTLLCVENTDMQLEEIGKRISRLLRSNDTIGLGEDGKIYLLLGQTDQAGVSVIRERMARNQIQVNEWKGLEG